MKKDEIYEMVEIFQNTFKEEAVEDTAEWYDNVAQGLAFATNSIQTEGRWKSGYC